MAKTKTDTKPVVKKAAPAKQEGSKRILSQQSLVTDFIKATGTKGTDAVEIAIHLSTKVDGFAFAKEMKQSDRAKALKKVRVLARKATGGASQSRDGRSAIYVIG